MTTDETIKEIRTLLKEAYDIAIKSEDYYGKSSEAYMNVSTHYPSIWEEDNFYAPNLYTVHVYSYVFGPSRMHDFEDKTLQGALDKALEAVKEWL